MMRIEPQDFFEMLLLNYNFHTDSDRVHACVERWLTQHGSKWIAAAIVESIYQGRYKLISVDRILNIWRSKQQPACHFDYDYAELVCQNTVQQYLAIKSYSQAAESVPSKRSLSMVKLPNCGNNLSQQPLALEAISAPPQTVSQQPKIQAAVKLVTKLTPITQVA